MQVRSRNFQDFCNMPGFFQVRSHIHMGLEMNKFHETLFQIRT